MLQVELKELLEVKVCLRPFQPLLSAHHSAANMAGWFRVKESSEACSSLIHRWSVVNSDSAIQNSGFLVVDVLTWERRVHRPTCSPSPPPPALARRERASSSILALQAGPAQSSL